MSWKTILKIVNDICNSEMKNNLSIFSIFTFAKIDPLRIFTDFHLLNYLRIWLNSDLKFIWSEKNVKHH